MVHGIYLNKHVHSVLAKCRSFPRRYYIIGAVVFCVLLLAAAFWPRSVTFSYAGKTCIYQPTIAPDLLMTSSASFRLEADQKFHVGSFNIAALRVCAVPVKAPVTGKSTETMSLSFMPWLRKSYTIVVPSAPSLAVGSLGDKPMSVKKKLSIPLAGPDEVFAYKVRTDDAAADCQKSGQRLNCDVPSLSLKQGADYSLWVDRYFKGKKVTTAASWQIKTLTATTVTASSVPGGQIVYSKPKSIELTADKALASGEVILERLEADNKRTKIPTQVRYEGSKAVVSWQDDLVRQAKFELIANRLTGADGSGLDGAYRLPFETSGGPKVKGVSVGTYKVPAGASATITFDQPIMASQDITGIVTASGGAKVTGKQGAQVFVSFAGAPRCGDVTLNVGDTLQSEHGVAGGSAWRYATRIICQVVGSIGSSLKGRPITTYSFGSGPQTVLYTGAIHGNESSSRALMLRWVDELESKPGSIPSGVRVVVIPAVNPDGVAAGSRTNARNVDLNRNFATSDWKADITTVTNAPFPGGGGTTALSEPESKALAGYVANLRPRLVLSYHSIGGLVAANQTGDSSARAASYARLSGYSNATGSADTFEYGISGTADDYYGQALGVPSVLIELGSHSDPQFARNTSAMWAMLR